MKLYLILLLQCILMQCILIQDIKGQRIRKNALYVEAESIILWGNASINYERIFYPDNFVHFSMSAAMGYGYRLNWGTSEWEPSFTVEPGYVCKIKGYIIFDFGFEIGIGYSFLHYRVPGLVSYNYIRDPYEGYFHVPVISIGYRSIGAPVYTKIYIGTWGLGLSLGYSF